MDPQAFHTQATDTVRNPSMTVLVVDDSATERLRITQLLKQLGYEAIEAINGKEALIQMQTFTYRLIISDQMMPEMDGRELCRQLRASGKYQQPYIIMLTANGETDDLVAGMDAGADDFLEKPCHKEELRVRLAAGVRMINMRNEIEAQNKELSLANHALKQAHQQTEKELALAALLQKEYVPEAQWLSPSLQLATHFAMTRGIGGDAMGVVKPSHDTVLFYQIDVMGHGIASAMLSFALQNAIQQMLNYYISQGSLPPLHQICRRLNERFPSERFSGLYFTMLIALVDEKGDKIRYCQAGHPHPCVISPDGDQMQITRGSFPVGIFDFADYETRTLPFVPGSAILISSDGLFDVESPDGKALGREAVEQLLSQSVDQDADSIMNRMVTMKRDWQKNSPLTDDISVMLIKRTRSEHSVPAQERPLRIGMRTNIKDVESVLNATETHLKLLRIEEGLIARIQTSLAELLNNYVEHAVWDDNNTNPLVELTLKVTPNWINIEVEEFAAPIPCLCPPKPIDITAESGRGYHILMNWVDQIRTSRLSGQNRWILQYKRS